MIRPLLGAVPIEWLFWAAYRRADPAVEWRMAIATINAWNRRGVGLQPVLP